MKLCKNGLLITLAAISPLVCGADFSSPPPPLATTYDVTPDYDWFNPGLREYYGNRIPGTKYCTSGCTPEVIEEQRKYNKNMKEAYKKGLENS